MRGSRAPVLAALLSMQQLADRGAGKVAVVGVVSKDGRPQATSFAQDVGARFPSAFDGDGELMTKIGLRGLPVPYFLDADGAVAGTEMGGFTSLDELRAAVAEHLGVRL